MFNDKYNKWRNNLTVKVHGTVGLGEFLTGNIDFFTITTIVPCTSTEVGIPLSFIKKDLAIDQSDNISTVGGITLFGINYADDDAYTDAFNKQNNLDTFIKCVEQRAQAIMLNTIDEGVFVDVSTSIPAGGHAADFGSTYSGNGGNIYTVKFATEHEDAWDEISFSENLNGRPIIDVTTPVISDPDIFDTTSASLRNTIILKNQFI